MYLFVINNVILFLEEEMVKFDNHIRTIYKKTKFKGEDQWPPFETKNFVNLLLIRHLEKNPKEIVIQKVACIMQKGSPTNQTFTTTTDISDIFKCADGTIVGARLTLIDGAPGVGRTILSKEIAYRWALPEMGDCFIRDNSRISDHNLRYSVTETL